jgi:hypothetical protein
MLDHVCKKCSKKDPTMTKIPFGKGTPKQKHIAWNVCVYVWNETTLLGGASFGRIQKG